MQFQDFNSDVEKQTPLNLKVSFPTNLFAIDRSGPPWTSRYFEPKHLFHQPLWFPSFRRQIAFHVLQHVPSKTLMHPLGSKNMFFRGIIATRCSLKPRKHHIAEPPDQPIPLSKHGLAVMEMFFCRADLLSTSLDHVWLQVSVHPFAPKDPTLFPEIMRQLSRLVDFEPS